MSKIGKMPIEITDGITVTIDGDSVKVVGLKGESSYMLPEGVMAKQSDGFVSIEPKNSNDPSFALWGLARAQVANLIEGVSKGFEKKLELQGVGYRAQMQGNDLVLSLGFSHPVKFTPKDGIKIAVAENVISISGSDKMLVGETAAKIRSVKEPEPYKGKGIRYVGEQVRRKAGKAAKAVGAK
ncbi:MAG: 50S ribosomal protein L6 [Candidatus Levybacteria bacterium]|nr:50S ribosomal protein L6 [Candidatus Levybacteria bacterium]